MPLRAIILIFGAWHLCFPATATAAAWSKPFCRKGSPTETDTLRYINGSVSVIRMSSENGECTYALYDLYSNKTYTVTESPGRMVVEAPLRRHANGALRMAVIHTYSAQGETLSTETIVFDSTNNPVTKHLRTPHDAATAGRRGELYFWLGGEKKWVLQETVVCQPVPTVE